MGKFSQNQHEAMRLWAKRNGCEDPESLIIRTESGVQFRGPGSLKSYKRIEKMYREFLESEKDAGPQ